VACPLLVKDLTIKVAGQPFHEGSSFLKARDHRAELDSHLWEHFRDAGFVLLGRTNTPEFGSTITTESRAHGPARNPWHTDHSTGGSSGGSGAAVASGMVPVAHANDGGGSIRVPASECGVVGLKPSRGRVSHGPDVGWAWGAATIDHVVTRTVRDTAAVLDVVSGYEPGDPLVAPVPARPFAAEVGADPGRLRIGFLTGPTLPGADVHPECAAAVDGALRALEGLGHEVVDAHPTALREEAFVGHFVNLVAAATAEAIAEWERIVGRPLTADDVEESNLAFRLIGDSLTAPQYLATEHWLQQYTRRMARWWEVDGYDLLVTPVIAGPPPPLGWLTDPEHGMARVTGLLQYTAQFNVTGQPAVSLPLHWTADGLPVGVQLVAAYAREDVLIRVASQLEQAVPGPTATHPCPPESRTSLRVNRRSAARDRGEDGHGLAVGHGRLEPVEEAHVVVGHEHVHEPAQGALLVEEAIGEAGVGGVERLEHLGHGGPLHLDGGGAAGERAEGRGDAHGHGHVPNPTGQVVIHPKPRPPRRPPHPAAPPRPRPPTGPKPKSWTGVCGNRALAGKSCPVDGRAGIGRGGGIGVGSLALDGLEC
jgi:amidase